jgi:hypothetical protein
MNASSDNDLLVCLNLENFSNFGGLVGQDVFKLFLLLTKHLHFPFVVGDVLVNSSDHVLKNVNDRRMYLQLREFGLKTASLVTCAGDGRSLRLRKAELLRR